MSSNENNNPSTSTKNYKAYLTDSTTPIPLSTLYRWQSEKKQYARSNEDNEMTQDCTKMIFDPPVMTADFVEIDYNMENSDKNNTSNDRINDCLNTDTNSSLSSLSDDEVDVNDNFDNENDEYEIIISDVSDDEIYLSDDNINNRDNNEINIRKENELYENSDITVDESVFNLLNFYMKNNMTKTALQQSLQMQLKILPRKNNMPKTLFYLLEYIPPNLPSSDVNKTSRHVHVSNDSANDLFRIVQSLVMRMFQQHKVLKSHGMPSH